MLVLDEGYRPFKAPITVQTAETAEFHIHMVGRFDIQGSGHLYTGSRYGCSLGTCVLHRRLRGGHICPLPDGTVITGLDKGRSCNVAVGTIPAVPALTFFCRFSSVAYGFYGILCGVCMVCRLICHVQEPEVQESHSGDLFQSG